MSIDFNYEKCPKCKSFNSVTDLVTNKTKCSDCGHIAGAESFRKHSGFEPETPKDIFGNLIEDEKLTDAQFEYKKKNLDKLR